MKTWTTYFAKGEWALWTLSVTLILVSFLLFDRESDMVLAASLVGATSLIFCAKGSGGNVCVGCCGYGFVLLCFLSMISTDLSAGRGCTADKVATMSIYKFR